MRRKSMAMLLLFGVSPMVAAAQAIPEAPDSATGQAHSSQQQQDAASKSNRALKQPQTMTHAMGDTQHETRAPAPTSGFDSVLVPTQDMQEPEAIELRTGKDLPAPELLEDVVNEEPMTLADFIVLSEKSNPTLRQARSNAERSRQQGRQVGLPPDPILGYSGDHIRGGSYHGGEEGVFFSQEIVLGRKLALRREIFRAEGRSNDLGVEIQRARVRNDVTKGFFDALAAQASVVIQDRLLKVALDAATNSHELMRIGQADASDVLQAETAAEQAKIDFVDAQRLFLSAFNQLATDAGQTTLNPHPVRGSLVDPPQIDAHATLESAVQESPAVRQAEAQVRVEEARAKSAKRETIPDLYLKGGEWYAGEELSAAPGSRTGWMSFAEAGVNVPLWNRNQGNALASKLLVDRAHDEVRRTELWTRERGQYFVQQYDRSQFTAERYRTEMLPRVRRAYQLEVMKYDQMAETYPKVLAMERTLFVLQLGYIRALHDQWSSATELQNFTLEGALEQPMSRGSDDTTRNLPSALSGSN